MTRGLALLGAAVVLGGAFTVAPQEPQFRGGTHTVSIFATVLDAEGRLVPDLTRDDFEVFEDGSARPLSLFDNKVQPITIVIMLDRSGSMVDNFTLVSDATSQFVTDLLPADRARLGSFSNHIQIDPDSFTSDHDALQQILHDNLQVSGPTPLWNATSAAMNALGSQAGRRVVLVFTDGQDSPNTVGPNVSLNDLRARSQAEEIMVYAIGLSDACAPAPVATSTEARAALGNAPAVDADDMFAQRRGGPGQGRGGPGRGGPIRGGPARPPRGPLGLPPIMLPPRLPPTRPVPPIEGHDSGDKDRGCKTVAPDPGLRDLASVGGGGYFELHGTDDLRATFARVADELHHQYLLAFTTDRLDNRVHSLEVRVARPDLTVRARHSYVAGAR